MNKINWIYLKKFVTLDFYKIILSIILVSFGSFLASHSKVQGIGEGLIGAGIAFFIGTFLLIFEKNQENHEQRKNRKQKIIKEIKKSSRKKKFNQKYLEEVFQEMKDIDFLDEKTFISSEDQINFIAAIIRNIPLNGNKFLVENLLDSIESRLFSGKAGNHLILNDLSFMGQNNLKIPKILFWLFNSNKREKEMKKFILEKISIFSKKVFNHYLESYGIKKEEIVYNYLKMWASIYKVSIMDYEKKYLIVKGRLTWIKGEFLPINDLETQIKSKEMINFIKDFCKKNNFSRLEFLSKKYLKQLNLLKKKV